MPRHHRRRPDDSATAASRPLSSERHEQWRGEQYVVRSVTGSGARKAYRCPGCDQELRPGSPHVVTWPALDAEATDRRHWHSACWSARDRRTPGVLRGRAAPRH